MAVIEKRESLAGINTLHELLELALDDLAKCERQPDKFRIDMDKWLDLDRETCFVCLAGATIAQRLLGGQPHGSMAPCNFDAETGDRLKALDKLRRGRVTEAYELVNGGPAPDYLWDLDRGVTHYDDSREAWWDEMRQLLADLKAAGV